MAQPFVIGIDSSTTGCKAIAWDPHGRAIAEGRVAYPIQRPLPDWAEQDPEVWWRGACSALKELSGSIELKQALALSITAQRESFVLLDPHAEPIRPAILWLDERSRDQVAAIDAPFGAGHYQQVTGKHPSMSLAVPKLLWLMEHEPEVLKRTAHLLDTHAYLVYRLSGELITSLACADPMGLMDMQAQTWSNEIIHKLGLRADLFPKLVSAGTSMGHVSPAGALESGLATGLPIIAGAGDGQCAGLGGNAIGGGRVYLNLGTAVVCGAYSPTYLVDPAFRTHCAPIPGGYFLETVIRGGVSTIAWFVEQFAGEPGVKNTPRPVEEQLEGAASKVPPGCQGLMVVPYWNSVMNPYWDPSAAGITIGWTQAHTLAHFYRAILEGIAFEQKLASDGMMAALKQPFLEYITVGGGSKSRLWCQIVADVTGIPVRRAGTAEASCLGAGILAASAAGWYPSPQAAANAMTETGESFIPEPGATAFYAQLYRDVYRPLFPTVQPLVDRLTELTHR